MFCFQVRCGVHVAVYLLYVCQTNQRKDMCLQPERTCVYNQKGHVFTTRKDMWLQPERTCVYNQEGHVLTTRKDMFATRNGMYLQPEGACVCNQKGQAFATRKDMCLQPERTRRGYQKGRVIVDITQCQRQYAMLWYTQTLEQTDRHWQTYRQAVKQTHRQASKTDMHRNRHKLETNRQAGRQVSHTPK